MLVGDPSKAGGDLGWEPKVSFKELVKMMVDADIAGDAIKIGIGHGSITDFASKYDLGV